MTSQAQAFHLIPFRAGFLVFPLHPLKTLHDRAKHLADVKIPMRSCRARATRWRNSILLEPVLKGLGSRATFDCWMVRIIPFTCEGGANDRG